MDVLIVEAILTYFLKVISIVAGLMYEWIMKITRLISHLQFENRSTTDMLYKLLLGCFNIYKPEHPRKAEDVFAEMLEAARRMNSHNLLVRYQPVVESRYQETHEPDMRKQARLAQATLPQVYNQIEANKTDLVEARNSTNSDSVLNTSTGCDLHTDSPPQNIINCDTDFINFSSEADFCSLNLLIVEYINEEMSAVTTDKENETSNVGADNGDRITTVGTDNEDRITTVGTDNEDIITTVGADNEERITTVGTDNDDRTTTVGTDNEERITTVGTDNEDRITTVGTDNGDRITTVGTDNEDRITTVGADNEDRITTVGTDNEDRITTVITNNENIIATVKMNNENWITHISLCDVIDSLSPVLSEVHRSRDGSQDINNWGLISEVDCICSEDVASTNNNKELSLVLSSDKPIFHNMKAILNITKTQKRIFMSLSSPQLSTSSQDEYVSLSFPELSILSQSETQLNEQLYWQASSLPKLQHSSALFRKLPCLNTIEYSIVRFFSKNGQKVHQHFPVQPSSPHGQILKRSSIAPVSILPWNIKAEDVEICSSSCPRTSDIKTFEIAKSAMIAFNSDLIPSMPVVKEGNHALSPDCNLQKSASTFTGNGWVPVSVNSHLHQSSSYAPADPLSDVHLSEAEMKSRRTVSHIISEMIQTERDYVRALHLITDHYVPEMQREDLPQMLRGKRTVIFGNLEKIQHFHSQYFLKQLERCQNQPFLVGQSFLHYKTMLELYPLYNKNKPKSDFLMMECGKMFFKQKQLQLGDRMDLSSYLLKPVQRMGKYSLLLKQLLKECAETELEYPELKAAEELVRFQLRHGNDLLAMDSLRDCDVNIQEQGRLLRQEEFLVFQGRKKSLRRLFLFEDLILFSKTKRGRQGQHDIYTYKTSFKTADIGLTENYRGNKHKFEIWFRRRSIGENYVLQCPSSEIKSAWVNEISVILWRQAFYNRELQMNELSTMGIGNKPCLDIQPSVNNIQDHSINILLNNKEARTRGSIAVTSYGYLHNGNKRPHSIISVSSTSSSGSSQSSFGAQGSLNIAFDRLDSPQMSRRSILSNESGIFMDSDVSGSEGSFETGIPSFRHSSRSHVSSFCKVQSYLDVMKSRVLRHKQYNQAFTNV